MKRLSVLLICFLGIFSALTFSVEAAELGIYFKPGYTITWIEKVPYLRNPFVEERGLLSALGANALSHPTEKLSLKSEAEIFGGWIDYKGSNLSDQSPYNMTGSRFGLTVEETASYKIKFNESFSLSPFIAVGGSYWHREVCAEDWYTGYGKLGIQGKSGMFFGKVGLLIPFFTQVDGGWENISWLNNGREVKFSTNPKGVLTPFAEVGLRFKKNWTVSFSYELKKWEESDRVNLGGGISAYQPETTQQIISLKLEYLF